MTQDNNKPIELMLLSHTWKCHANKTHSAITKSTSSSLSILGKNNFLYYSSVNLLHGIYDL